MLAYYRLPIAQFRSLSFVLLFTSILTISSHVGAANIDFLNRARALIHRKDANEIVRILTAWRVNTELREIMYTTLAEFANTDSHNPNAAIFIDQVFSSVLPTLEHSIDFRHSYLLSPYPIVGNVSPSAEAKIKLGSPFIEFFVKRLENPNTYNHIIFAFLVTCNQSSVDDYFSLFLLSQSKFKLMDETGFTEPFYADYLRLRPAIWPAFFSALNFEFKNNIYFNGPNGEERIKQNLLEYANVLKSKNSRSWSKLESLMIDFDQDNSVLKASPSLLRSSIIRFANYRRQMTSIHHNNVESFFDYIGMVHTIDLIDYMLLIDYEPQVPKYFANQIASPREDANLNTLTFDTNATVVTWIKRLKPSLDSRISQLKVEAQTADPNEKVAIGHTLDVLIAIRKRAEILRSVAPLDQYRLPSGYLPPVEPLRRAKLSAQLTSLRLAEERSAAPDFKLSDPTPTSNRSETACSDALKGLL